MSKKWMMGILLIVLCGGGSWFWAQNRNNSPKFQAVSVIRDDLSITVPSTGIVTPENRVEIKPPIAGRVEEVLVQEGDTVRKGQIIAWMSSTERSALLDLARVKGEGEVKRWETLYKPTPLISPISGTVIARLIQPGQTVNQDAIMVLCDHLIINAQVDETDIGKIKVGQNAKMTLDAYPKNPFDGKVSRIAYEAQTVNNVTIYTVYVTPQNTSLLKSGMTADVLFTIQSKPQVLTIPVQALVRQRGNKAMVITNIQNPKKPKRTAIKTGISNGQVIEVMEGLTQNDTVYIPQKPILRKKKAGNSPFNPSSPRGGGNSGGSGRS